jgi:hypothetical protein
MASYSNSSYTNDFFNLSGIYFNSTVGITTGLAPIESNSSLYLLKSGGTISSNLLINGSLDVKSTFTLETIGNVATKINEKQDLITDESLTISKILNLTTILAGKQDVTTNNTSSEGPSLEPSSNTFNEIISSSIINNNKNIEDRDHFHYTSTLGVITVNRGASPSWNSVKRGSDIYAGQGFIPKYTGLYSISVSFFLGSGSTGIIRVGLNVNGVDYKLNGTSTFLVCGNETFNLDSNMISGNIVVDSVAGQYIRLKVEDGPLRYLAQYSYFHGYYIGSS